MLGRKAGRVRVAAHMHVVGSIVAALLSPDAPISYLLLATAITRTRRMVTRTRPLATGPVLRLGQRVLHKQLGYRGVVVGWDMRCCESEEWIAAARVGECGRGIGQPFYHVSGGLGAGWGVRVGAGGGGLGSWRT